MSNGRLHDDKLFQGLNDRLSDYEAPYDGADWDTMSRSLDKLPKTNNFRWKFSLNTIGIMLGIVGLTVLGVVVAAEKGQSGNTNENSVVTVKQNDPPVVTHPQTKVVAPVAPTTIPTNEVIAVTNPEMNTIKDLNKPKRKPEITAGPFIFGDQIDPAKGIVSNTGEDPALIQEHKDMKKPEVYYDIENGQKRKIIIPNDSVDHNKEIKTDSAPAPIMSPEPAAPTEGQRIGFDEKNP